MSTQWIVQTHGDPLGTVRHIVHTIWAQAGIQGMLVSLNGEGNSQHNHISNKPAASTNSQAAYIVNPEQLSQVNPFKPVMSINTARMVPSLLSEYTDSKLGALLRPCELRALIEMVKHSPFSLRNLLTICVDCLGTFSPEEYHWRTRRKESTLGEPPPDGMSQESLQFARQGGIMAYRFRPACQVCESPGAHGADLNIKVFGLPVRQVILIETRDVASAERLGISAITDDVAESQLIQQNDRILAKAMERHRRTMDRITQSLGEILPQGVDELIVQLEKCGACQSCMNVCPICSIDAPRRDRDGHYSRESVVRWLVSCAGCGMCEQACPNHLPLGAIFGHIRKKLDEELDYTPGRSIEELLPVP